MVGELYEPLVVLQNSFNFVEFLCLVGCVIRSNDVTITSLIIVVIIIILCLQSFIILMSRPCVHSESMAHAPNVCHLSHYTEDGSFLVIGQPVFVLYIQCSPYL